MRGAGLPMVVNVRRATLSSPIVSPFDVAVGSEETVIWGFIQTVTKRYCGSRYVCVTVCVCVNVVGVRQGVGGMCQHQHCLEEREAIVLFAT